MPTPPPLTHELAARYEGERVRKIRGRVIWYACVVLCVMTLSVSGSLMEMEENAASAELMSQIRLSLAIDAGIIVPHAALLLYAVFRRFGVEDGRRKLFRALTIAVVFAMGVVVFATPMIDNSSVFQDAVPEQPGLPGFVQQVVTLISALLVYFLATFIIALSVREGLQLFVPLLALYWIGLAIDPHVRPAAKWILAGLAPLCALPGFAWSWWRYRGFQDRFYSHELARRYVAISDELAHARQVHEALFPPPVTRGPIRVHYRYEPMGEIGGDFLFVAPAAAAPSSPRGSLTVVVIDVTGHGISAALAVNRLYVELGRIMGSATASENAPSPADVITALNAFSVETLTPQAIYASAVCVRVQVMEEDAARVEICSAGHPPPMLRHAGGIARLDASNATMLGVIPEGEFRPDSQTLTLGMHESILLYTDGAFEARDGQGRFLGMDEFERIVVEHTGGRNAATGSTGSRIDGSSAGEDAPGDTIGSAIPARILSRIVEFREGPPQDDTLIVEISRSAG
jgi:Stage II sporulation protein E (SpoIIE)